MRCGACPGDRLGWRRDAGALCRRGSGWCDRPARRQRLPLRHLHHRAGQARFGRGRTAGATAPSGSLTMAKSAKKKSAARPGKAKKSRSGLAASAAMSDASVLDRLYSVVESRRAADPAVSHSARLLSRGPAKVAQKFGEEAVECLIEA